MSCSLTHLFIYLIIHFLFWKLIFLLMFLVFFNRMNRYINTSTMRLNNDKLKFEVFSSSESESWPDVSFAEKIFSTYLEEIRTKVVKYIIWDSDKYYKCWEYVQQIFKVSFFFLFKIIKITISFFSVYVKCTLYDWDYIGN